MMDAEKSQFLNEALAAFKRDILLTLREPGTPECAAPAVGPRPPVLGPLTGPR